LTWRLTTPSVIPDSGVPYYEETPDSDDRNTGLYGQKYRTEMSKIPDSANAATSENATLLGLDTGFSKYLGLELGVGGGAAATARTRADDLLKDIFSKPKPKPPKRVESERVDHEPVEDAVAGPPCDVCASRPAVTDGKCGQCLCVAAMEQKPPPTAVPAIQESMKEKRAREIARLRAAYPDEDAG
jgi:hypothetical protein